MGVRTESVVDFAQGSVFVRWLVVPLAPLATLLFVVGLVVLPAVVVAAVVLYYLLGSVAVMAVGLVPGGRSGGTCATTPSLRTTDVGTVDGHR